MGVGIKGEDGFLGCTGLAASGRSRRAGVRWDVCAEGIAKKNGTAQEFLGYLPGGEGDVYK